MLKEVLLCVLIGYTLGNLNPAYVLAKRKGYDARVDGSGNAGASNAFILAGKTAFFIALTGGILPEHPLSAGLSDSADPGCARYSPACGKLSPHRGRYRSALHLPLGQGGRAGTAGTGGLKGL